MGCNLQRHVLSSVNEALVSGTNTAQCFTSNAWRSNPSGILVEVVLNLGRDDPSACTLCLAPFCRWQRRVDPSLCPHHAAGNCGMQGAEVQTEPDFFVCCW